MNFSAFGSFPTIHHQFSTAATSTSAPSAQVWNEFELPFEENLLKSIQENRYTYNQSSAPTSSAPVKFRTEEMTATQNKYVTHYPATTTHLQYYNAPSNQQEVPKTSYGQTSTAPSLTTSSELSQDITSLLMKEQGSDSNKRVLQSSSVADYLSHLPTSLSLHHFLKYSADAAIKKEAVVSKTLEGELEKQSDSRW